MKLLDIEGFITLNVGSRALNLFTHATIVHCAITLYFEPARAFPLNLKTTLSIFFCMPIVTHSLFLLSFMIAAFHGNSNDTHLFKLK